jgi:hypothetical protein
MDEKAKFEAWAGKRHHAPTTSAWDYAFKAWVAATAAERERAAKVCERERMVRGGEVFAAAIRGT